MHVRVQREDFDVGAEVAAISRVNRDVGAIVTFTGVCRGTGEGEPITAILIEHYPEMAETEICRQVADAERRWSLAAATVIHRHGRICPGENIVLVVTASKHRHDAFAAAEFLMDYLKTRAPFWKREERASGTRWVAPKQSDDRATARWSTPKAAE
jgi:molybdopterin synthase catalytic subunit